MQYVSNMSLTVTAVSWLAELAMQLALPTMSLQHWGRWTKTGQGQLISRLTLIDITAMQHRKKQPSRYILLLILLTFKYSELRFFHIAPFRYTSCEHSLKALNCLHTVCTVVTKLLITSSGWNEGSPEAEIIKLISILWLIFSQCCQEVF